MLSGTLFFFFSLCDSYRLERILTVRSVYLWLSRLFKQIIMIFFIYKTWKIMSAFWVVPRIKLVYVCKSGASSSYLIFFFFGKDSKRMIRFLNRNKFQESCSNYFIIMEFSQLEYCSDYAQWFGFLLYRDFHFFDTKCSLTSLLVKSHGSQSVGAWLCMYHSNCGSSVVLTVSTFCSLVTVLAFCSLSVHI